MTAPISKKQKKEEMRYLAKILWVSSIILLVQCSLSFFALHYCQEIGLVALMFFFELLFSYVSSQFPFMFPLLTYYQLFFSLSGDYLRHSRRRRSKISILLIPETV